MKEKINTRNLMLVILFIACMAFGFIMSGCKKSDKEVSGDTPEIQVARPLVEAVTVYESYPGVMQSQSEAEVVARVNGQIISQHFQEGSNVSKGQLLYTIESSIYASSVNEAKAQLESARGQLQYAEKHLAALEEGLRSNAVSEMDVIQARSAKAEAQASVNQCAAALNAASTKLGYCRVVAPVSGKISASNYDVGAYVNGEGSPVALAKIYNDNDLEVKFSIPDYAYNAIADRSAGFADSLYDNIPVEISTGAQDTGDSAPGNRDRCSAALVYESPDVDVTTGTVNMKAKINPGAKKLKSGMYCKVYLPKERVEKGILIRDASISTDQRGNYVYVVNDSNKVVYTPIKAGDIYQDTLRLVVSGLKPDDRYVTRAMISVRSGEKVKPVLVDSRK